MKLKRVLLALGLLVACSRVSGEASGDASDFAQRRVVRVVKRKRVEPDSGEREGRSIVGTSFPFIEKAKHTLHASTQQHHPQRISALRQSSDPSFLAKLREHERQRERVFGKSAKSDARSVGYQSFTIGSSGSLQQGGGYSTGAAAAAPAAPIVSQLPRRPQPRAFTPRPAPNRFAPGANQYQGQRQHAVVTSHQQSDSEALREHSAALRRHREQLEAAKRLIRFHEEKYLKHRTDHIVPLPPPIYHPKAPRRPIQNPVIANRRRQQVRQRIPRPVTPVVTTAFPNFQSSVPQIQGYIEPAVQFQSHAAPVVQVQSHAAPAVQFPRRRLPAVPQSVRAAAPQAIDFPEPNVAPTINLAEVARERCIDKVVYVEEIVEDDAIECHHSYEQKCHTTYVTDYKSESEEECEENFKKDCFIEYKPVAMNETVEFCHTPLVKDCNIQGPVDCKTEYETECRTRYHEHQVIDDIPDCQTIKEHACREVTSGYKTEQKCQEWPVQKCSLRTELVSKSTPETKCEKVPKKICAPQGCGFVPGIAECFDKTETVIQDIPEETCNLQPQKHCKQVTKLVPNLQPTEECVDVPKEVCTKTAKNPRKVKKPVTKKWCYTPTKESGLI